MTRVIITIFIFISIFIFPWWLAFLFGIVALIFFENYYEFFVLGLITDSLYNAPMPRYQGFEFVITIATLFLFVVAETLKRRLRIG